MVGSSEKYIFCLLAQYLVSVLQVESVLFILFKTIYYHISSVDPVIIPSVSRLCKVRTGAI